jgi:hypothetical protein
MQSPTNLNQKLTIWVDDKPEGNSKYVSFIESKDKMAVIQLTSTKMALQWAN